MVIEPKEMSRGKNTGFLINIPQSDYKLVESLWRNYVNERPLGTWIGSGMKQVGNLFRSSENKVAVDRLRIEKIKDELYLHAIKIDDLSEERLNVYAKIAQIQSFCQFVAFFQFTDSVFIGEQNVSPEMFSNLKNYIREFGIEAYRKAVMNELETAKADLREKERELKKLETKKVGFEKSINGLETDIYDVETELRLIQDDIKKQDEKLYNLKSERRRYSKKSYEYDSVTEQIKSEEKTKKEILSSIKKLKNRISKYDSGIKAEEGKIRQNLDQQEIQQRIISKQQLVVNEIAAKLEKIR